MKEQLNLNPEDTPFEFPCRFPLKIMGEKDAGIEELVKKTLTKELEDSSDIEFTSRESSGGKYISITATVTANSKDELDRVYHTLSTNEKVKWMV